MQSVLPFRKELSSPNKAVDTERLDTVVSVLCADAADPGTALKVALFRCICADLVRFDKVDALRALLDLDSGFCARYHIAEGDDRLVVNKPVVESGLFKVLDQVGTKKSPDADRAVLRRARALCVAVQGLLPAEMSESLQMAAVVLSDPDDQVDADSQSEALRKVEEAIKDTAYSGFLKAFTQHSSWPTVVAQARATIASQQKKASGKDVMRRLHAAFLPISSASETAHLGDKEITHFASCLEATLTSLKECDASDHSVGMFVEFLGAHGTAIGKLIKELQELVGKVLDKFVTCAATPTAEIEAYQGIVMRAVERLQHHVRASQLDVALELSKPWRFKSAPIEQALKNHATAKHTAERYGELIGLLFGCALEFGSATTNGDATKFFSKNNAIEKLVGQMGSELESLKHKFEAFKSTFSAEEQGRKALMEVYMPDLRSRCRAALQAAVTHRDGDKTCEGVESAIAGLDAAVHRTRQVVIFSESATTIESEALE